MDVNSSRPSAGAIGGSANEIGSEYRRGVGAYVIAHALAGEPLRAFNLHLSDGSVESVSFETDLHVDDVSLNLSSGLVCQIQARSTTQKGKSLEKAIAQWRNAALAGCPDPRTDRLLLVTAAPSGFVLALGRALNRMRADDGSFTKPESEAIAYVKARLVGLAAERVDALLKCVHVVKLELETRKESDSREGHLLLGRVFEPRKVDSAWREIKALVSEAAALRVGYKTETWCQQLAQRGYEFLNGTTPAAKFGQRQAVLERYVSRVQQAGLFADLRALGADLPPVLLANLNAAFEADGTEESDSDRMAVIWRFRRRGRVVLTGLPGGGKTTGIRMLARDLSIINDPLPVVVSLRVVDADWRTRPFRERFLDAAVRLEMTTEDQRLLRAEIEHRLEGGDLTILFDGLDETYGRRSQVVSELQTFVDSISPGLGILLSTRDVAYSAASTLGWAQLRLSKPDNVPEIVSGILGASATAAGIPESKQEAWINERSAWVETSLQRDNSLRETPLFPTLLALLAAEGEPSTLPSERASVLYSVIKDVVKRHTQQSPNGIALGALSGDEAARAALDGFAVEAAHIQRNGGETREDTIVAELTESIQRDWQFGRAPSSVIAEAIVTFWDETGVFVKSRNPAVVAPRISLFAEVGDAHAALSLRSGELAQWVRSSLDKGRHESLVLAAGLSQEIAQVFIDSVARGKDLEALRSAIRALTQGAKISTHLLHRLIERLLAEVSAADQEGWFLWPKVIELAVPLELREDTLNSLDAYPPEYKVIAKAATDLAWFSSAELRRSPESLLACLRLETPLSKLPTRRLEGRPFHGLIVDRTFASTIEKAADVLLGSIPEATELVLARLESGSLGTAQRLENLLIERGFQEQYARAVQGRFAAIANSFKGFSERYDSNGVERFLRLIAEWGPREMTIREAVATDELADYCRTLDLNDMGAWPARDDGPESLQALYELVATLGGFERRLLAAQAQQVLNLIEHDDSKKAFFALLEESSIRELDQWAQVADAQAAFDYLVKCFYKSRVISWIAANAIVHTTIKDAKEPMKGVVAKLSAHPEHLRIAAITLTYLQTADETAAWVGDQHPVIRQVAASTLPAMHNSTPNPLLLRLSEDNDGNVRKAALERMGEHRERREVRALLETAATSPDPGWLCLYCSNQNAPATSSCKCHIVGPSPSKVAQELLDELGPTVAK